MIAHDRIDLTLSGAPEDLSELLNTLLKNVSNGMTVIFDLIQTVPLNSDLSDVVRQWLMLLFDELQQHARHVQVVDDLLSVKKLIEIQCTDESKWRFAKYCAIEQAIESREDFFIFACMALTAHYFMRSGVNATIALLNVSRTARYVSHDKQLAMLCEIIKRQ